MKISKVLKLAMVQSNFKSARALSEASGFNYARIIRVLRDENVSVVFVIDLLAWMGFELKAVCCGAK